MIPNPNLDPWMFLIYVLFAGGVGAILNAAWGAISGAIQVGPLREKQRIENETKKQEAVVADKEAELRGQKLLLEVNQVVEDRLKQVRMDLDTERMKSEGQDIDLRRLREQMRDREEEVNALRERAAAATLRTSQLEERLLTAEKHRAELEEQASIARTNNEALRTKVDVLEAQLLDYKDDAEEQLSQNLRPVGEQLVIVTKQLNGIVKRITKATDMLADAVTRLAKMGVNGEIAVLINEAAHEVVGAGGEVANVEQSMKKASSAVSARLVEQRKGITGTDNHVTDAAAENKPEALAAAQATTDEALADERQEATDIATPLVASQLPEPPTALPTKKQTREPLFNKKEALP